MLKECEQLISYLGLPEKVKSSDFKISSYRDLLLLLFDVSQYNLQLGTNIVCLEFGNLNLDPKFFKSQLDERDHDLVHKLQTLIFEGGKERLDLFFFVNKDFFLASQLRSTSNKTVLFLTQLSDFLEKIGIRGPSIIIRVGSAYGNRKRTMKTFCRRFKKLPDFVQSKIIVTNDEKPSLFSVTDLMSVVYYETKIPICFRSLAHYFNDGGLSVREALFLSCSTWNGEKKPIYFYSEAAEKDSFGLPSSFLASGYLTTRIPTFGLDCNVIIDSPTKDQCMINYLANIKSLPPLVIDKVTKKTVHKYTS